MMRKNNNRIKEYKPGDNTLLLYMDRKIRIHLLGFIDVEDGVRMAVFKWWNRYKKRWVYSGKKFADILMWNHIVWELDDDERDRLFALNNFDYQQLTK